MYGKIKVVQYDTGYCKDFDIAIIKNAVRKLIEKENEFVETDFEPSTNRIVKRALMIIENEACDKEGVVKSKDVRYWISISLIDHGYYKCAKKYIEEPFIKEIEDLKKKNAELQQKIDTLSL